MSKYILSLICLSLSVSVFSNPKPEMIRNCDDAKPMLQVAALDSKASRINEKSIADDLVRQALPIKGNTLDLGNTFVIEKFGEHKVTLVPSKQGQRILTSKARQSGLAASLSYKTIASCECISDQGSCGFYQNKNKLYCTGCNKCELTTKTTSHGPGVHQTQDMELSG